MHVSFHLAVASITALAVLLAPAIAFAQEAATFEDNTGYEACTALDFDPRSIYNDLLEFKVVFGKPALKWTEGDYNQLLALADACNGTTINAGRVVDTLEWHRQIEFARSEIFPLSAIHQVVMSRVGYVPDGDVRMPDCTALLTYTYDTIKGTDNSLEVFGEDMLAMQDREVQMIINHANQCQLFLPDYANRFTTASKDGVVKLLNRIMDHGLFIKQRRREWNFRANKAASDLIVEINGIEIPATFALPETQKLVNRYNRSARFAGGLSMDTVAAIIGDADDILNSSPPQIDRTYAEAIKTKVNKSIFDRTELKLQ